jgi:glycosyltransferase involved in cell wall biosynthesis
MERRENLTPVSVVIPSHRGGRFLREAVASVQSQTQEDWEVVVVLDGAEDDLSDIERSDHRIRVFRQQRRGVSIARNVGVRHARSELIAFLDDDDRMLPGRLTAQLEVMKDDNIGLCHTGVILIGEDGEPLRPNGSRETQHGIAREDRQPGRPKVPAQYLDFLRGEAGTVLSSVMVRRYLFYELGGFNPLLPVGEDLDFFFRIASETTIDFLPEALTEYRRHSGNTWSEATTTRELKLILSQHVLRAESRGDPESLEASRIGLANLLSGRAVFALKRAREAQQQHNYLAALLAVGDAMYSAPRGTLRAVRRTVRKELGGSSLGTLPYARVRPHRGAASPDGLRYEKFKQQT